MKLKFLEEQLKASAEMYENLSFMHISTYDQVNIEFSIEYKCDNIVFELPLHIKKIHKIFENGSLNIYFVYRETQSKIFLNNINKEIEPEVFYKVLKKLYDIKIFNFISKAKEQYIDMLTNYNSNYLYELDEELANMLNLESKTIIVISMKEIEDEIKKENNISDNLETIKKSKGRPRKCK